MILISFLIIVFVKASWFLIIMDKMFNLFYFLSSQKLEHFFHINLSYKISPAVFKSFAQKNSAKFLCTGSFFLLRNCQCGTWL